MELCRVVKSSRMSITFPKIHGNSINPKIVLNTLENSAPNEFIFPYEIANIFLNGIHYISAIKEMEAVERHPRKKNKHPMSYQF